MVVPGGFYNSVDAGGIRMNRLPFGAMRRREREITDRSEIEAIIKQERIMHLAFADGGTPFLVPVFYAWDGASLYVHSARQGRKVDIMERNPTVCFEISQTDGVVESEEACDFEARHRTVIGYASASFVEEESEKIRALDLIVGRFTDQQFVYPPAKVAATAVIRLMVLSLTGKSHGWPV